MLGLLLCNEGSLVSTVTLRVVVAALLSTQMNMVPTNDFDDAGGNFLSGYTQRSWGLYGFIDFLSSHDLEMFLDSEFNSIPLLKQCVGKCGEYHAAYTSNQRHRFGEPGSLERIRRVDWADTILQT